MRTALSVLLLSLLLAGCNLYPTEYNLDGKKPKPKPDPTVPVNPSKPATPVTPLPSNLPDQDVIKAVADAFTSSTDPRARFDAEDYAGYFQAMSEIISSDSTIKTPKQVVDAGTHTRAGLGLEHNRYPALSKVVGDYMDKRMPTVIDDKGRATVVEILQVLSAGCHAAALKLNGKAVKDPGPTQAPAEEVVPMGDACDPPTRRVEPVAEA